MRVSARQHGWVAVVVYAANPTICYVLTAVSPGCHRSPPLPPRQLVQDWRAFRARLVAMESGQAARAASMQLGREERWAHLLSQPERGCLLVARPRPGLGMFANTGVCVLARV